MLQTIGLARQLDTCQVAISDRKFPLCSREVKVSAQHVVQLKLEFNALTFVHHRWRQNRPAANRENDISAGSDILLFSKSSDDCRKTSSTGAPSVVRDVLAAMYPSFRLDGRVYNPWQHFYWGLQKFAVKLSFCFVLITRLQQSESTELYFCLLFFVAFPAWVEEAR